MSLGVSMKVSGSARSLNDARSRVRQLSRAIESLEVSARAGTIDDAEADTKTVLGILHELEDARRCRGEWEHVGWGDERLGEWDALLGVRNVGLHTGSSVVARHDGLLCWDVDRLEIRGATRRVEYTTRLDDRPVAQSLRRMADHVSDAVPS